MTLEPPTRQVMVCCYISGTQLAKHVQARQTSSINKISKFLFRILTMIIIKLNTAKRTFSAKVLLKEVDDNLVQVSSIIYFPGVW